MMTEHNCCRPIDTERANNFRLNIAVATFFKTNQSLRMTMKLN